MDNDFASAFKSTPAASGFALVDEGNYEAEITEAKLDLAKEIPRMSLTLQIIDDEQFEGRKLFVNYNLAGEGISYLKKDLETLGLNYADVGSPEDVVQLFWDNLPLNVVIYVKHKEWQGKMYCNAYINELASGGNGPAKPAQRAGPGPGKTYPAPAKTAQATAPAARTAQPAKTAPKPTGKKPPQRQPDPEPDFSDSDEVIPF